MFPFFIIKQVKPRAVAGESLGSELTTNGGFSADTDWTKGAGWTITGGVAVGTATSTTLNQSIVLEEGHNYRVVYTVGYTGGDVYIEFASTSLTTRSSSGTFSEDFIAAAGDVGDSIYITTGTSFTGTIDNVSVKEVL